MLQVSAYKRTGRDHLRLLVACQIEQPVEVIVLLYARRLMATCSEAVGPRVLYHSRTYPAWRNKVLWTFYTTVYLLSEIK